MQRQGQTESASWSGLKSAVDTAILIVIGYAHHKRKDALAHITIMSKEELFEKYGVYHLWYHIGDDKEKQKVFLQFAKDLGFKWPKGAEIHPETDNCSTNMGLNIGRGTIGFLTYLIWYSWENAVNRDESKRIDFETGEWYDDPNAKKAVP